MASLIADLGSATFAVRQKAERDLTELGEAAEAALRKTLELKLPLENRRRIELLLEKRDGAVVRTLRAIEVLEYVGTSQARGVLEAVVSEGVNPRAVEAAQGALKRIKTRMKGRR